MTEPHPMNPYKGVRCSATSRRTGQQCGQIAPPGAKVCKWHGGDAPAVKRKAAIRLLQLVDPAVTTLAQEMVDADKSVDRQRAANSILDRAGVPRMTDTQDSAAAREILVERLLAVRDAVISGEVVPITRGDDAE